MVVRSRPLRWLALAAAVLLTIAVVAWLSGAGDDETARSSPDEMSVGSADPSPGSTPASAPVETTATDPSLLAFEYCLVPAGVLAPVIDALPVGTELGSNCFDERWGDLRGLDAPDATAAIAAMRNDLLRAGWNEAYSEPDLWIASFEDRGVAWIVFVEAFPGEGGTAEIGASVVAGDVHEVVAEQERLRNPTIVDLVTGGGWFVVVTSDGLRGHRPGSEEPEWISPTCPWPDVGPFAARATLSTIPVVCDGSTLALLDLEDGTFRWEWPVEGSPDSIRQSAELVLVDVDDTVHALDAETGVDRWTRSVPCALGVAHDGTAFVSGDDLLLGVDIESGEDLWRRNLPCTWIWATPEGLLARLNGSLTIHDPATGERLLVTERTMPSDNTAILGAESGIAITNATAQGQIAATDLATGSVLWEYQPLPDVRMWARVDTSYVSTWHSDGTGAVLDLRTGAVVFVPPAEAAPTPVVAERWVGWLEWTDEGRGALVMEQFG